jgi:hypothetical protein
LLLVLLLLRLAPQVLQGLLQQGQQALACLQLQQGTLAADAAAAAVFAADAVAQLPPPAQQQVTPQQQVLV